MLGDFTTKQLAALVDLHLFAMGVEADFEGEYGVFRQEILDSGSELYQFKPQVLFLATTWRDVGHRPGFDCDQAEVARLIEAEQRDWSGLWQAVNQNLGCQVIQNNFTAPAVAVTAELRTAPSGQL